MVSDCAPYPLLVLHRRLPRSPCGHVGTRHCLRRFVLASDSLSCEAFLSIVDICYDLTWPISTLLQELFVIPFSGQRSPEISRNLKCYSVSFLSARPSDLHPLISQLFHFSFQIDYVGRHVISNQTLSCVLESGRLLLVDDHDTVRGFAHFSCRECVCGHTGMDPVPRVPGI